MKTKLRTVADRLSEFHGRIAKKAEGRGWKTLTFIAACFIIVAIFGEVEDTQKPVVTLAHPIIFNVMTNEGKERGEKSNARVVYSIRNVALPEQPKEMKMQYLSETENTVIVKSPGLEGATEEVPKSYFVEFGGTPGKAAHSTLLLTLSRPVEFLNGIAPVGTKVKYVTDTAMGKYITMTKDSVTVIPPNGTIETAVAIPQNCVVELGGTSGGLGKTTPAQLKTRRPSDEFRDEQRFATIPEIIEAAKNNAPIMQEAFEAGERVSKSYNGNYIFQVNKLKEIVKPVTTAEAVSLRPEFERLNIRPRKSLGRRDTCTLHATAVALEYLYKKDGSLQLQDRISLAHLRSFDPDAPFNEAGHQTGSLGFIVSGVMKHGVATEEEFPVSRIGSTPSAEIQAKARSRNIKRLMLHGLSNWQITSPSRTTVPVFEFPYQIWNNHLEIGNQIVMQEIKNGRPILIGTNFPAEYGGDMTAKKSYRMDRPHAVLVVGYKTEDGSARKTVYEFIDSRGEKWGDKGYGTWNAHNMISGVSRAGSLSLE